MARDTPPDAMTAFLEQFDHYVAARATLRQAEDGSDDEHHCINNCADQWRRLLILRDGIQP